MEGKNLKREGRCLVYVEFNPTWIQKLFTNRGKSGLQAVLFSLQSLVVVSLEKARVAGVLQIVDRVALSLALMHASLLLAHHIDLGLLSLRHSLLLGQLLGLGSELGAMGGILGSLGLLLLHLGASLSNLLDVELVLSLDGVGLGARNDDRGEEAKREEEAANTVPDQRVMSDNAE